MADISQVIQQGTDRVSQQNAMLTQQGASLSQQANNTTRTALEATKLKMIATEKADQITNTVLTVLDQKQRSVSQAKNLYDDAFATLDKLSSGLTELEGGLSVEERRAQEQKAKDEVDNTVKALEAAKVQRNAYVESLTKMPGVAVALNASSYANKDITDKILSPEVWASMTSSQRSEISERITAIQRAQQEASAATGELEQERELELARVKKSMSMSLSDLYPKSPTQAMLTYDIYQANLVDQSVPEVDKQHWYFRDVAYFLPAIGEFKNIPPDERSDLHESVFKKWTPEEGVSSENQTSSMQDFADYFSSYYRGIDTTNLDPMTQKILERINILTQPDEDGNAPDPRRLGVFMESIKGFVRPIDVSRLQPKTTAEAGI